MTRHRRLFMAVVVVLSAAVSLSACSIGEGTDPGSNGTPSPTPTPSSAPAPPPGLPDAAMDKTVDGGVAFVTYYYKLVEYGHAAGGWQPLRELTEGSCKECRKFWGKPGPFKKDEDVLTEVGAPNPRGIEGKTFKVVVNMRVGPDLSQADSEVEVRDLTKKLWQDDVTIAYNDGWKVVEIEPDQLLPYESCIADRCRDHQEGQANGAGQ